MKFQLAFQSDNEFWDTNLGILIGICIVLVKILGNFYAEYKMRQISDNAKMKETNCICRARKEEINVERATGGEKRG